MHLKQLTIKNFKSFADVTFHLNPELNVFTGVNNCGKTTALEAIALWAECFRARTWQAGKRTKGSERGEFRLDGEDFIDPSSVRSPNFGDIFFDLDTDRTITLETTLADGAGLELPVAFSVRYARGNNYAVKLLHEKQVDFRALNAALRQWPAPIQVAYASPVAALSPLEDFETAPKIRSLVGTRRSMQVLRNRLYQLRKNASRFQELVASLSFILSEDREPVAFEFRSTDLTDVRLRVNVRVGPKDVSKDISLLGSGTLQIIEILLAIYEEPRDLNIVLLDEPDSHIHRDIQRRLINKLREHTERTQIFLTTHNESLIRSTPPQNLFHVERQKEKVYHPVSAGIVDGKKRGLQPSRHLKILRSLGTESSIDLLNALEAERLILVEGEDDARFIQSIVENKTSPKTEFRAMYWSFGGIERALTRISVYRELFQEIKNDRSLWDKAVLVLDRDCLTEAQRAEMTTGLAGALRIPVYVSTSYTMEATVLKDPALLSRLIEALMRREGATPDAALLEAAVQSARQALAQTLPARLSSESFLKELFHRMKKRREQLETLDIKATKAFADDKLQVGYVAFTNEALGKGDLHLLATKEDVVEVVRAAYAACSVDFNDANLFERLIDASNPGTWVREWSELANAVK